MADALELRCTDPGFEKVQRDFDKLPKSMQKVVLEGSAVGRQFQKMEGQLNKTGKSGKSAMSGIAGEVSGMLMSYASLAGAIGLATRAMRAMNEERKRGAQGVLNEEQAIRQYGQLTNDPKEIKRMVEAGRTIARVQGVEPAMAHQFQFSMESIGQGKRSAELAKLFDIATPEGALNIAQGAVAVQKAFGGDVDEIVNQILVAAQASPTTAEQFAPGVLAAAPMAGMQGASASETMAVLSQLTFLSKLSPDEAATQMQAFSKALITNNMQGGFLENVQAIQAMGMSQQELQKFFGRIEGLKFFENVSKISDDIKAVQTNADQAVRDTGTDSDFLQTTRNALEEGSPEVQAAKSQRQAKEGQRQAEQERFGEAQLKTEAALSRINEALVDQPALVRLGGKVVTAGIDYSGEVPRRLEQLQNPEQAAMEEGVNAFSRGGGSGLAAQIGIEVAKALVQVLRKEPDKPAVNVGDAVE